MMKLIYDNNGIPVLDGQQIEVLARDLLADFDSKTNGYRRLSSMEKLLEYIEDRDNVEIGYEDLSSYGEDVCGLTDFANRMILIDEKLAEKPELENIFNFTCGHEIGHWELHRHVPITTSDNDDGKQEVIYRIVCKNNLVRVVKDTYNTPRGFLEWQANSFSAALLLPPLQVRALIMDWQKERGIRNVGKIHLDNQQINQLDYMSLSAYLSNLFGVSRDALKIRLKNLDILNEPSTRVIDIVEYALR